MNIVIGISSIKQMRKNRRLEASKYWRLKAWGIAPPVQSGSAARHRPPERPVNNVHCPALQIASVPAGRCWFAAGSPSEHHQLRRRPLDTQRSGRPASASAAAVLVQTVRSRPAERGRRDLDSGGRCDIQLSGRNDIGEGGAVPRCSARSQVHTAQLCRSEAPSVSVLSPPFTPAAAHDVMASRGVTGTLRCNATTLSPGLAGGGKKWF